MNEKKDETRTRILQAAAQLFGEKGYARTTTREIAEQAAVNEVTLFRHFGSKANLIKAIMENFGGPGMVEGLESQLTGDYRVDMAFFGQIMMAVLLERRQSMRMMLCEATHFPELRAVMVQNPRQLRQMIARYLEGQMGARVIHPGHPEVLAQAFLGMFFAYAVSLDLLDEPVQPEVSLEEITDQFVETFLRGTMIVEE